MDQIEISKEIAFWKLQTEEHMLFIYQGLVDDFCGNKLKKQAVTLHQSWYHIDEDQVMPLIEETLIFLYLLVVKLKESWIGWISVSFVNHMIKETKYFKSKMLGELTKEDEIKFWLWHHHSECDALEKLIDPSENTIATTIKEYSKYIQKLEADVKYKNTSKEIQNILNEYLDHTDNLEQGIMNHTIYTNISPILINHAIREGYYAIETLDKYW